MYSHSAGFGGKNMLKRQRQEGNYLWVGDFWEYIRASWMSGPDTRLWQEVVYILAGMAEEAFEASEFQNSLAQGTGFFRIARFARVGSVCWQTGVQERKRRIRRGYIREWSAPHNGEMLAAGGFETFRGIPHMIIPQNFQLPSDLIKPASKVQRTPARPQISAPPAL